MTFEEILELPDGVAQLEAMSDEQLRAHFEPFLQNTLIPEAIKNHGSTVVDLSQVRDAYEGDGPLGASPKARKAFAKIKKSESLSEQIKMLAKQHGVQMNLDNLPKGMN